ncbi:MAG: aminopeptidase P N-terminal domain-containing protein [Hydrogenophilus sp.]|nr:aminopeptidase P N-terminal domain-containing protein [Hydrogenophilus sp.]
MTHFPFLLESDLTPFQQRRQRLLQHLESDGAAALLLPTAPERRRNRAVYHPYRQDSDFYYLTGLTEPGAWLLLRTHAEPRVILFCQPRDPKEERWNGERLGPERAPHLLAIDAAFPLTELEQKLPDLLAGVRTLYVPLLEDLDTDAPLRRLKQNLLARQRDGIDPPATWRDVRLLLARHRQIKDPHEIAALEQSARIAVQAHLTVMRAARPGTTEAQLEAILLAQFREAGAEGPAYPPIVAGGPRATTLHYTLNRYPIEPDHLVLIDAGCEYRSYASDITRTFPISGRFTPPQRELYQLVLTAQNAAIQTLRPGALITDPHDAAVRTLVEGLIALNLLAGDPDELIRCKAYERFYPHRTSHWLGLDVHDVGPYAIDGRPTPLQPGMVLTIEPGLYIQPADDIPSHYWGIGIRIEDNVLITETGHRLLTRDLPVLPADLEALLTS